MCWMQDCTAVIVPVLLQFFRCEYFFQLLLTQKHHTHICAVSISVSSVVSAVSVFVPFQTSAAAGRASPVSWCPPPWWRSSPPFLTFSFSSPLSLLHFSQCLPPPPLVSPPSFASLYFFSSLLPSPPPLTLLSNFLLPLLLKVSFLSPPLLVHFLLFLLLFFFLLLLFLCFLWLCSSSPPFFSSALFLTLYCTSFRGLVSSSSVLLSPPFVWSPSFSSFYFVSLLDSLQLGEFHPLLSFCCGSPPLFFPLSVCGVSVMQRNVECVISASCLHSVATCNAELTGRVKMNLLFQEPSSLSHFHTFIQMNLPFCSLVTLLSVFIFQLSFSSPPFPPFTDRSPHKTSSGVTPPLVADSVTFDLLLTKNHKHSILKYKYHTVTTHHY